MNNYIPFKAIFNPTKTDDLRESITNYIDKELTFSFCWTMDEDDPFPGEDAYICDEFGFWVPERDIERIIK